MSDFSDAVAFGRAAGEPQGVDEAGAYVVIPKDCTLHGLERYRETPARRRAAVNVADAAAFVAYVAAYRSPSPAVFADVNGATFVGVLDYHAAGETGAAGWGEHRASLKLTPTPEWIAWREIDGKPIEQSALADFLEDHVGEIAEPAGATLIEAARALTVTHGSTFVSTMPGAAHTVKVSYTADERATGPNDVTLPTRLTLGIAPFEGTTPYKLVVRLRVLVQRAEGRPAVVRFVLSRILPERVTRDAARVVADAIAAGLGAGVPMFAGTLVRVASREGGE